MHPYTISKLRFHSCLLETGMKKCEKDRNKLHLTLPGVPSPQGYVRGQDDIRQEGCEKSEESQYVHMRQTGMLSQQAIQPVHVI